MPRTIETQTEDVDADPEVPSDAALRELRIKLDHAERDLTDARRNVSEAISAAAENGITITHIAAVLGWSRQWCYSAIARWQ